MSEHLHTHLLMPASSLNLLHLLLESSSSSLKLLSIHGTDEESATVEPQSRASDHSRSPQSKKSQQKIEGEESHGGKKLSDLPKAKKHKLMVSDEEDEEPHNEPGTSSNSQPIILVLPLHSRTSSQ